MDTSNWINFGMLAMTALVGILTWIGTRKSATDVSIGPNGHLDIMYVSFAGGKLLLPCHLRVSWDDDLGIRGEWSGNI